MADQRGAEKTGGILGFIERTGNRLPDPALLFVYALIVVWLVSAGLSGFEFEIPAVDGAETRQVTNQLTGTAMTSFLSDMVRTFTGFHPLGVVLVALLGVGVAESSGFIDAVLKRLLGFTPKSLLTPMLIFVAVISHTAADAGYVLVIPLGGVIFYAAGRHPLAGIAAAFAGVSGGFSANFIPSAIDPLLQGLSEAAANIIDPDVVVNPLCNLIFTGASCLVIVGLGWIITDRVIEPRLKGLEIDGDPNEMPKMDEITDSERKGMNAGLIAMVLGIVVLGLTLISRSSPFLDPDTALSHGRAMTSRNAPLMKSIVPLIFLLFLLPGVVHGYVSGRFRDHRDVIKGMSKTMSTMGYYIVMAFFASLFIYSFGKSELGALLAVKGATFLQSLGLPGSVTIMGIILLCGGVNLLVGSASAKWALLSPILIPMLMQLGISPELTQAAYRVGDSTTNIVTPLMPYFPLVVAFSQRYVKKTGIGTLVSLMLPYTVVFLIAWTLFLLAFWALNIPLGIGEGTYTYP